MTMTAVRRGEGGDAGGVERRWASSSPSTAQSTRHRFPSACLASQPPDDRTSAFDPLAGIETEPMNLPSGIATQEESNPEDIASSEALISFLVSPRGEKVCRPREMGGYTFFDEADLSTFIFFAPIMAFLVGVRDSCSLLILYMYYVYVSHVRSYTF